MQIRFEVGAAVVEILKAPFGSLEPIGLLFERLDEITWGEVIALFESLKRKEEFTLGDFRINWDGVILTVSNHGQLMTIPWSDNNQEQFAWMVWLRSIDPY